VQLASLLGANRSFVQKQLPHIGQMLKADLAEVIAESDLLVMGLSGTGIARTVAALARPDQYVLDLVKLPNAADFKAEVEGLCW
jgi:GDP-mannose 6-dehydrogenase